MNVLIGVLCLFAVPWVVMAVQVELIAAISDSTEVVRGYIYNYRHDPWYPPTWLGQFYGFASQLSLVWIGEVAAYFLVAPGYCGRRGVALVVISVAVAVAFPVLIALLYRATGVLLPQGRPFEWWPYWLGWPVFLGLFIVGTKLFPRKLKAPGEWF